MKTTRRRLPTWLDWYLKYGLQSKPKRQQRRQIVFNSVMVFFFATALAYSVLCSLYDWSLWPTSLIALVFCLVFLLLPFLFDISPTLAALFGAGISTIGLTFQSFLISSAGNLHIYLFLIPLVWLVALGPQRMFLVSITGLMGVSGMLVSEFYFNSPALPAAGDPLFLNLISTSTITSTAILITLIGYFAFARADQAEDALETEHARSEALLYNLLPEEIATRLKIEPNRTIADKLPKVAILFADIVNFTPRAASLPPEDVVDFLNRIFSSYDELTEKHGLEKIKTIGDAYMVAAGMPSPIEKPVHSIADMALDVLRVTRALSTELPDGLEVRIGLHAGTAVAGVIGNNKLFYDVWGETVNTASRMESHGEPGRIHVTGPARDELAADYTFEPRGTVDVKGMGSVETWWLTGKHRDAL